MKKPTTFDLTTLQTNARNPQITTPERLERLRQSLADLPKMMRLRPLVYDPDTMTVLGGNKRLTQLLALGYTTVPVEWVASAHDFTPEERRRFVIADNVGFGDWDAEILTEDYTPDELEAWGLQPDDWGDDPEEQEAPAATDDGYAPPDDLPTDIVPGDLITIGPHRLLCGDSTNADDVARLMGGEKSVLCHADPPYGMGKESEGVLNDNLYGAKLDAFQLLWWSAFRPYLTDNASVYIWGNAEDLWRLWFASELSKREKMYVRNEIVWDKKSIPGMKSDLLTQYATATERCLYIQLGEQFLGSLNSDQYFDGWDEIRIPLEEMANKAGLTPSKLKDLCGVGMYSHWFTKSQWCLIPRTHYDRLKEAFPASFNLEYEKLWAIYNRIKGAYRNHLNGIVGGMRAYFDNGHDIMYDVWSFSRVTGEERAGHATPKPVEMTGRCIKSSSPEGEIVVEPFLGSGTTMVAAHQLNRRCYGLEIDPKYCQVIIDRMHKLDPTLPITINGKNYEI